MIAHISRAEQNISVVLDKNYIVLLLQQSDVQSVKDAISSAVDVMQAMASSIYSPLSKVISFAHF